MPATVQHGAGRHTLDDFTLTYRSGTAAGGTGYITLGPVAE